MMPTLLGNLLRAAEEHAWVRYGLEAGVCWPRLWFLLPKDVREEIAAARSRLNETTRWFGWGLLFVVWTVWAWWAAPVGLLIAGLAWQGMTRAALVYGDLVRAAFDLYHPLLFEHLGWPKPKGPEDGRRLTEYLARGIRPLPLNVPLLLLMARRKKLSHNGSWATLLPAPEPWKGARIRGSNGSHKNRGGANGLGPSGGSLPFRPTLPQNAGALPGGAFGVRRLV
jgi:hypothetical protein